MVIALDYKRFKYALMVRDTNMDAAAEAADVTYQHLRYVLLGERRASRRLLTNLKAWLGEAAWKWVTKESDVPPDAKAKTKAA